MRPNRLLHRDIKPENILLDGELRAFVADYGACTYFLESTPPSSSVCTLLDAELRPLWPTTVCVLQIYWTPPPP